MSDLAYITTHGDDAVARLIGQYQGKPIIAAIIRAIVNQYQQIEDALWQVYLQSWLINAVGPEIDIIGDIVGQKRNGSLDAEYKVFVQARIRVNYSTGKLEQILDIASLILGSTIGAREYYPGSIIISADGVTVNPFTIWRDFLNKAKGAAKKLDFVYSVNPSATTIKRGSTYGSIQPTASQKYGSVYVGGIGGGFTSGVFA